MASMLNLFEQHISQISHKSQPTHHGQGIFGHRVTMNAATLCDSP